MGAAEHWKPVAGWESLYKVSDQGRVWSVRAGRVMRPGRKGRRGRRRRHVNLWDGSQHTRTIATLVAAAFLGPRPAGFHVHHKSGDPSDDRLENLEYRPGRDHNQQHGREQRQGDSKLDAGKVARMRRLAREGHRIAAIAKRFGVPYHTAKQAISGKYWKQVDEPPVKRPTRGSGHHLARFTESQVRQMRRLFDSGATCAQIARRFDAALPRVWSIVHRHSWKHVR